MTLSPRRHVVVRRFPLLCGAPSLVLIIGLPSEVDLVEAIATLLIIESFDHAVSVLFGSILL